MRRLSTLITAFVIAAIAAVSCTNTLPDSQEVKEITQKVADWQIEHFEDQALYRAPWNGKSVRNNKVYHDLQWQNAAFFTGLYQFTTITQDASYINWLNQMGRDHNFKLHNRFFHADDHAVGQFYLHLYEYYGKPQLYYQLKKQFDEILAHEDAYKWHWWWCDALFMAPPVWARLAKATHNKKYLEYMDTHYHMTYDKLWCEEESLFYRDMKLLERKEKNGKGTFWARGNGWVFGGLALMIPDLPSDWEGREFYVELYKTMAAKIKDIQREDGTWSAGLLGDVEDYPSIETSGTSFFTFGLAWGIRNGLLDRKEYEPTMLRGWEALVGAVNEEGMLTHVQGVGFAPEASSEEYTEVYGSGAFIAAGSELYKYIQHFNGEVSDEMKCDAKEKDIFMHNGGWCWYQGPRAVISNDKLVIGGLDGVSGDVNVSVYDLKRGKIEGELTLDKGFQCDDHNAPAFYVRPDGKIVTMWAKHGNDKIHRIKISSATDYLEWSDKIEHKHIYEDRRGVTYMNIYYLQNEESLFCFFRDGPHFNPAYITSKDQGETWSEDTHLIANEVKGRHRPYTIYSQVDENRVGIVYTDGHPRDFGNSLYYVEFDGKSFYRASGEKIHDIKNGPLPTTHGEKIYTGSEVQKRPITCESVPGASWNCNMVSDAEGNPHIGYTLYNTNDDHRFRLMSWDGAKWNDREIAYGGRCLYYWESSYTGLMAIDPTDTEMVYISTDVDPSTGEYLGGVHEIYSARVKASDDITTIKWSAITTNSTYRNIRPIIVANDGYKALLWLNGRWDTYCSYDVRVVGRILDRP